MSSIANLPWQIQTDGGKEFESYLKTEEVLGAQPHTKMWKPQSYQAHTKVKDHLIGHTLMSVVIKSQSLCVSQGAGGETNTSPSHHYTPPTRPYPPTTPQYHWRHRALCTFDIHIILCGYQRYLVFSIFLMSHHQYVPICKPKLLRFFCRFPQGYGQLILSPKEVFCSQIR